MEKISILIVNYNNGKYFADCYYSIINQTYDNWEVVIIDDASTDDSLEIIQKIIGSDSRFRLYKNQVNKGCGTVKRKCIEYAVGEIAAFLDPDDALYPTALERSVQSYSKNGNIVATYTRVMMCDEYLNPQKPMKGIKQVYNTPYFFNCPIQVSHFFTFKKETYLKTQGINPDLRNAVDQDLYLKILEHGNPLFINENLYYYRCHSKGISQHKSKHSAKESFARVIYESMVRRNINKINYSKIPDRYNNSAEIYSLLNYQQDFFYRLKIKFKFYFQQRGLLSISSLIRYCSEKLQKNRNSECCD
ncbi:glycosyltransferase family 2 protein [Chryseobacterium viscerum]|nr:glycosyltransferase family 2 protein [Chryseobacterium viscerum]